MKLTINSKLNTILLAIFASFVAPSAWFLAPLFVRDWRALGNVLEKLLFLYPSAIIFLGAPAATGAVSVFIVIISILINSVAYVILFLFIDLIFSE